ncbi:MAG: hypothetical protein IM568_07495 [Flavobacterium sp.]|nr:hypothetical protein [Flavobacterium sp.]
MENQLAEFYQNFIQNSLMPKEREDYNFALKTFKLTQENFLELLEDIIDNHFIEVDGEIIPDLSNLAKSKLIKSLGPYDNSKIKKEQVALRSINQHLLSLFTVVKNHNFKTGLVDEDYNRKTENANKVLFERFAHLNNPTEKVEDIKGQHSFIIKKLMSANTTLEILKKLKNHNLVDAVTSTSKFQKIFSGDKILNDEKVDWIGTKKELKIFLQSLKPKLRIDSNIYYTAIRCFTINGKEIIKTAEISNSSGTSSKKQIIEDTIFLF